MKSKVLLIEEMIKEDIEEAAVVVVVVAVDAVDEKLIPFASKIFFEIYVTDNKRLTFIYILY